MNAVGFPNMLQANKTVIVKDLDATKQNLTYLLQSYKKTMLGDPYFGTNLRKLFYESNNAILRDLVIDDIYSAINNFMPQIRVTRKDITVTSDRNMVMVNIIAQNLLDFSFAEYNIKLLEVEEIWWNLI